MDYTLIPTLQPHLTQNERLIWTGQPKGGIVLRTNDIFLIPFSLLWCGFAVFWFVGALNAGISVWFALVGLPFVAIGLMFVFGRFILDARARAHTYYGLTHDRIIIKSGVHKTSVTSIPLATLTKIDYEEKKDGTGTITLGPKNPMMTWGRGMHWWVGIKPGSSLELIQDVVTVYNKIIEIQKKT